MVADGILSWLTFAGIPHAAIDTDWQHHTLSDRYKMHLLDATSSEDEFEQLLENLPESPTLIVDFPGNKNKNNTARKRADEETKYQAKRRSHYPRFYSALPNVATHVALLRCELRTCAVAGATGSAGAPDRVYLSSTDLHLLLLLAQVPTRA